MNRKLASVLLGSLLTLAPLAAHAGDAKSIAGKNQRSSPNALARAAADRRAAAGLERREHQDLADAGLDALGARDLALRSAALEERAEHLDRTAVEIDRVATRLGKGKSTLGETADRALRREARKLELRAAYLRAHAVLDEVGSLGMNAMTAEDLDLAASDAAGARADLRRAASDQAEVTRLSRPARPAARPPVGMTGNRSGH